MERLTERNPGWLGEEFWISAREPDEGEIDDVYERLKYYEDLAESGSLVVLPCKVGETVWFIRPLASKKEITKAVIEKMVVKGKGVYMKLSCNAMYETSCNSIGKTVFLTYEEAEATLKGKKGGETNGQ